MKHTFGEALQALRKQKGLSQQEFADLLPVNSSRVANWEADRRLPNATIIAKIAEILDAEISELLDTDSEKLLIEKALSNAVVTNFNKPSKAIEFAKEN